MEGSVALPVSAPLSGANFASLTPREKAEKALGSLGPNGGGLAVSKALEDGSLTYAELTGVFGLTPSQVKGLNVATVAVSETDPLDEADMEKLAAKKEKMLERFSHLFSGVKSGPEIEKLFNEVYQLALKGELDNSQWDGLMEKYGLNEYKMNRSSFSALLGGYENFSDNARVEGLAELSQALYSLDLTMSSNFPATDDPKEKAKQIKQYCVNFKDLCSARNFNIIDFSKFGTAATDALKQIARERGLSLEGLTNQQILEKIRDSGELGEHLQELAKDITDWDEFLAKLLNALQEAVNAGTKGGGEEAALTRAKRMTFITSILNGKEEPAVRSAFINQLVKIFSSDTMKVGEAEDSVGRGVYFDYEKVKRGEVEGGARP